MKKYIRLIKPVLSCPDQHYNPVCSDLENPEVWYPEDQEKQLRDKYKHLESTFQNVLFKEKYIEDKQDH